MPDPQRDTGAADRSSLHPQQTGSDLYTYYSPSSDRCDTALLVEEVPLAISCNGVLHAIMMISPLDIEDFVTGFALSENLINQSDDIRTLHISPSQHPSANLTVDIQLQPEPFKRFLQQQRSARRGASSCGLCGTDSLQQVFPLLPPLPDSAIPDYLALENLRNHLPGFQQLGQTAGGIHAALLLDKNLNPLFCREDIGRHNALDKVIGAALSQQINLTECSVLMSSRCSTELVIKAARSGLPNLIHLSSPSTLAVKLAEQYRIRIIHLPRKDAARIYARPEQANASLSAASTSFNSPAPHSTRAI
ncbi:MAG: formate dehydrogenase family accessory protein FdhD [Oceanospirillaceae bacterium]|nr:formate dehydrogenase family accessory protein FdhD [Oceanospirillaceae bacterium]MBT12899.1 formate dehydrogenase family accessory protein FdhD [Oceanospirillaceae bacterium]|tara:strand:- start:141760 stop:142677 length:918 start_codon:yes stop_codon:yes gene_type:complete